MILDAMPAERPGPLVVEHIVASGFGRIRVDRWPAPRVVVADRLGDIMAVRGDPAAVPPDVLAELTGFVDAGPEWVPLLGRQVGTWERIIAVLPGDVRVPATSARLLGPGDSAALAGLDPDSAWTHDTWGGADGMAAAQVARGMFDGPRLVSVATPFHVGRTFTDIGVLTEPGHRGRGHSTACAAAVVADARAQGRTPTWTTSPDNVASRAVAARLGFVKARLDVLHAVRVPVPVDQ